ncbi:hypothetical protein [Flagellimonas sp.]|uniref:hypothetical protein n=1 Tax=Flagellimonas sp. TaxID=2058762 RepID=UPI003AB14845
MESLYNQLINYFNNTPEQEIKKTWNEAVNSNYETGTFLDEFLFVHIENHLKMKLKIPKKVNQNKITNFKNPSFTSDFSFLKVYGES